MVVLFPKPTKKSKKRNKNEYTKVKNEYLQDNPVCEACFEADATEVHHSKGRTGSLLTDSRFFFALCHTCHAYIHANPKEAYEKGFLLERNRKE